MDLKNKIEKEKISKIHMKGDLLNFDIGRYMNTFIQK